MLYVVLRPVPSSTPHRMCKMVALASTRQEALALPTEDGDELWFVHGAKWLQLSFDDASIPTVNDQLVLF